MNPTEIKYFFLVILFQVFSEIILSSLVPLFFSYNLRLSITSIICIFIILKKNYTWVPILLFFFQFIHSFFSIQGWETGLLCSTLIWFILLYVKDMVHLSTGSLILFVGCSCLFWFFCENLILGYKVGDFKHFFMYLNLNLIEFVVLLISTPLIFSILEKLWPTKKMGDRLSV